MLLPQPLHKRHLIVVGGVGGLQSRKIHLRVRRAWGSHIRRAIALRACHTPGAQDGLLPTASCPLNRPHPRRDSLTISFRTLAAYSFGSAFSAAEG